MLLSSADPADRRASLSSALTAAAWHGKSKLYQLVLLAYILQRFNTPRMEASHAKLLLQPLAGVPSDRTSKLMVTLVQLSPQTTLKTHLTLTGRLSLLQALRMMSHEVDEMPSTGPSKGDVLLAHMGVSNNRGP